MVAEEDRCQRGQTQYEFHHLDEAEKLVVALPLNAEALTTREVSFEKWIVLWDEYQEQPHLLDPHLPAMFSSLLKFAPQLGEDSESVLAHEAFKYLAFVIKVRGYKRCLKYFPHEVADVEQVVLLLSSQQPTSSPYETRFCLLCWLAVVAMVPFDLARFHTVTEDNLLERLLSLGQQHLRVFGKTQDAAAFFMSKFLSRADARRECLSSFITWACHSLSTTSEDPIHHGILRSLHLLLKHGWRSELLPHTALITEAVAPLSDSKEIVKRKLFMKVMQRLALTHLEKKAVAWRYDRGRRLLAANLPGSSAGDVAGRANGIEAPLREELAVAPEQHVEVPEVVEHILGELLTGLSDGDSVVRWSAAKGVGRVALRLPTGGAEDVLDSVLSSLDSALAGDAALHGGCLALAELSRHGLLLPTDVGRALPLLSRTLTFDELRGSYSVGSCIRDAACYVVWAFARAYRPADMKPYVVELARTLVPVILFDREIQVRRAAAAAFQEHVGRQGNFPRGIDIVTICDYFSVAQRSHCYSALAVDIAGMEEYSTTLLDYLADNRLKHWDPEIRTFAADCLAEICATEPTHAADTVVPKLLKLASSSPDINLLHGAISGLAKLIPKLERMAPELEHTPPTSELLDVLEHLKTGNLFKGTRGELIRVAACAFISCLCRLEEQEEYPAEALDFWFDFVTECVLHLEPLVADAGVAVVKDLFTIPSLSRKVPTYCSRLTSAKTEPHKVGYARALGALPCNVMREHSVELLSSLSTACVISKETSTWADSRRYALLSLTEVVSAAAEGRDYGVAITATLTAISDYTSDERGDVGASVREAAMTALVRLALSGPLNHEQGVALERGFAQQSCEKIRRTRLLAIHNFSILVERSDWLPHSAELKKLILSGNLAENALESETFPVFVKLLGIPELRCSILSGCAMCIGGMTDSLKQSAGSAVVDWLFTWKEQAGDVARDLVSLLTDSDDRTTIPLIRTLDYLLVSGTFDSVAAEITPLLLPLVKKHLAKSTNVVKLDSGTALLCTLLQWSALPLSQLTIILCHRYPRIRTNTAALLYEALSVSDLEGADEACELLENADWSSSVDTLRPIRDQMCDLLGVKRPVPVKK